MKCLYENFYVNNITIPLINILDENNLLMNGATAI